MFGGTVAPSGYVACNGATYATSGAGGLPVLFAAIGYTWGGSGSSFKVPLITDRAPVGAGNSYTVGQLVGTSQVTLTAGMLPAHTHSITDNGHVHPAYTNEVGPSDQFIYTMNTSTGNVLAIPLTGNAGGGAILVGNGSSNNIHSAATGIIINSSPAPTQSVPTVPPSAAVLFIIRAY